MSKKELIICTLEQSKKHLQDVIVQQVDATVCPLDDAKIHAAIVDYMVVVISEGGDDLAKVKYVKELAKLFEEKLGGEDLASLNTRIDSVYDTVRAICYLADKGTGPLGWGDLSK